VFFRRKFVKALACLAIMFERGLQVLIELVLVQFWQKPPSRCAVVAVVPVAPPIELGTFLFSIEGPCFCLAVIFSIVDCGAKPPRPTARRNLVNCCLAIFSKRRGGMRQIRRQCKYQKKICNVLNLH